MCRLLCTNGLDHEEIIEILDHMETGNRDGFGFSYLDENNQFKLWKVPISFSEVMNKKKLRKQFLSQLPKKNWILFHERAKSHGPSTYNNTHPFISPSGKFAICHNGIFSEHDIVKLCLEDPAHPFKGETDSEAGVALIDKIGVKKFTEEITYAGVWACLENNGNLWIAKTSGQLAMDYNVDDNRVLISSELNIRDYPNQVEALVGWYKFDREGRYIKHKKIRDNFHDYSTKWGGKSSSSHNSHTYYEGYWNQPTCQQSICKKSKSGGKSVGKASTKEIITYTSRGLGYHPSQVERSYSSAQRQLELEKDEEIERQIKDFEENHGRFSYYD